ncbi:MAG: DUF2442 domain-containing protein [Clostridiales Family XIII bacterium]|jgi:hypothetical protein|nr:DUF2442 domain-containing protein [Clostridiales Family XIII bacterium]
MKHTDFFPKVLQVVPGDDYKVYAYMNDGSVRFYDPKPLIKKGTVFEPLLNEQIFVSALTILNDTVAWDIKGDRDPCECIDVDPFTVFSSPVATDPLELIAV